MVLFYCNIVNNQFLCDSWVLSTFFPNNLFSQLLDISPTNQIYTETFCSEFQNSVPLDIKDRIHLTLVANDIVYNEIFN